MPLRTHLLAIATIIMTVFTGWLMVRAANTQQGAPEPASPYRIEVVRASWGLNCPDHPIDKKSKKFENNFLGAAKQLCAGKVRCDVSNNPAFAQMAGLPTCPNQLTSIEYRCYSFDQLREIVIKPGETGSVNCAGASPPEATRAEGAPQ